MLRRRAACLIGGPMIVVTLAGQGAGPRTQWRIAQAPAEFRPMISRADLVIAAMQDAVLRELNHALAEGGPEHALQSCHLDATVVTQRIGRAEGLTAGRTSDRLRTPSNAPKPWAAPIVKEYAGRRARDVDGFAVDLGDTLGVLRPIVEGRMCATCHGPLAELSLPVQRALTVRYPMDRGVGFKEGEIRGWFWVEIPKR